MALTPQNEETFFREVDDELRREQLTGFWRRYGRIVAVAVVAALVALGGFLYWQHRREQAAGVASEQLSTALRDVADNKDAAARPPLTALAADGNDGYRATAKLTLAAIALEKGDAKAAASQYGEVASDASLAKPFRDLALIRQTATEFDAIKPEIVVERLRPLAVSGNPWFGSAGELVAIAYQKMGKRDLAGPLLAAIGKDKDVPETIRTRAARLATVMGAEAGTPAQPAIAPKD